MADEPDFKAVVEVIVAAAAQPSEHRGSTLVGTEWLDAVLEAIDDARVALGQLPFDTARANVIERAGLLGKDGEQ